jgi:hypothetical protein
MTRADTALRIAAGTALVVMLDPAPASAQTLTLASPSSFKEALLQTPPTTRSGLKAVDTLVGIRTASAGNFDATKVHLGLGASDRPGELCLKLISRDGRYSASARYKREPGKAARPAVEIPTRYGDVLKGYAAGDMSVQGFFAPDCALAKATELLVAASSDAGGGPQDIIVQVNAPASRIRAQLLNGDKPLADPVLCESVPDGPRTGFTGECRLKAATAGLLTLVLTETTSTGFGQRSTYAVRVLGGEPK